MGLQAKLEGTGKKHLPVKRKQNQTHVDKEKLKRNVSEDEHSSHTTANRGRYPIRLSNNRNGQWDKREFLAGHASGICDTSIQSRVNSNPNTYPNSPSTDTQREIGRQISHQNQYQLFRFIELEANEASGEEEASIAANNTFSSEEYLTVSLVYADKDYSGASVQTNAFNAQHCCCLCLKCV